MVKLWKFEWDSDSSFIGGVFKATHEEGENLIGKSIYIGEADGKHSEVYGTVEREEISLVSADPTVVVAVPEFGYNPLKYIDNEGE